jgi:hypothetical protein
MLAVAGGILLAVFIGLMLWGLILVIRDGARFVWRNLGFVSVATLLAVGATLWWSVPRQVSSTASPCTGSCLYR